MMHYNNDNNAYCSAVNDQMFKTREHNIVQISTLLHTRNLCSYSHLEIFISIYNVRVEIDQISTNTFPYTMCSAPNVYMFVYTLIGAQIVPLSINTHELNYAQSFHGKVTSRQFAKVLAKI